MKHSFNYSNKALKKALNKYAKSQKKSNKNLMSFNDVNNVNNLNNLKSLYPVQQCPVPIGSTVGMMIMHTVVGVKGNIVSVRNHNDGKIYQAYCNTIVPTYGSRPGSVKKRGRKVSKRSKRKRSSRKLRSKRRKSKRK